MKLNLNEIRGIRNLFHVIDQQQVLEHIPSDWLQDMVLDGCKFDSRKEVKQFLYKLYILGFSYFYDEEEENDDDE